jgi:hypothetical protein
MALTALKGKKIKRKAPRARAKTGVLGAPVDRGFDVVKDYFHYEIDRKEIISIVQSFVKKNFSKTEARYILANPDYKISYSYFAATAFWYNTEQEVTERSQYWFNAVMKRLSDLIEPGKTLYNEKSSKAKSNNVVTLSPQQRLQTKISNTIMQDLLNLEDAWIEGEKASVNVYDLFRKHGLSGSATIPVRTVIEGWLLDYEDAYHKRCEQAVEGYSHIKRPELNRRIKECKAMLEDLDRIKAAKKAVRKTNKTPSLEKQVSKVKYKKEDNDFKIVSINPAQIVGKTHLLCFNTKYKKLIEYKTESTNGFVISGTTIKNINSLSRAWTLRKPMDLLPKVLSATPKQFELLTKEIKTKPSTPNGRINEDTIILKVLK